MGNVAWELVEHRGPEGFLALEEEWRRLYDTMPSPMPWHSFEAYSAYLEHLCPGTGSFRCLTLSDGEHIRAILPIEERFERGVVGKGPGLRLRVWGPPLRLGWPTTDAIGPEDEAREALLPLAIEHLRRQADRPAILDLGRMRGESVLWHGLEAIAPRTRFVFPERDEFVVPTDMTVEEFLGRLSGNNRRNLRVKARHFEALDGASYTRSVTHDDLMVAFGPFLDVEASGWKGEAGTAILQQPGLPEFYSSLLERLSADGQCEIHALWAEGRCIAACLCVVTRGTMSVLKSGYDESYAALSPGILVNQWILESACENPDIDVVDEIADAPWLRHWHPVPHAVCRAYVSLRPVTGALMLPLLRFWYGPLRTGVRRLRARRLRGVSGGHGSEAV